MTQNSQQTIPKDKFLLIAANLLHKQFIGAGRTTSKRIFREIEGGRVLPITTVKMEDESTVRFSMQLDHSEYCGQLNYGAFKANLSMLLGNLARALQEKTDIAVFSMENSDDTVLFGVTGVTVENEQANVMVLGSQTEAQAAGVTLRLMYLNPEQFARAGPAAVAGS